MNAPESFLEKLEAKTVKIQLNGKSVEAKDNETILKVARREGIDIPLCATRMTTGKMVTVGHALSRLKERGF